LLAALLGEVFDGDEVFERGDEDLFAGFAYADGASAIPIFSVVTHHDTTTRLGGEAPASALSAHMCARLLALYLESEWPLRQTGGKWRPDPSRAGAPTSRRLLR
jgi:hypothetical protein